MIQSVQRALAILEVLAEEPARPRFLSEIAGRLDLKLGTCANLLKTLTALHYANQAASRKGYTLGVMAYSLTRNGPYRKDLIAAAEPVMGRLAQELREAVLLAVLVNGKRIILCQTSGDDVFQVRDQFLMSEDIYKTATGRLLLAYAPAAELAAFLARKGLPDRGQWADACTDRKFKAALDGIREAGYVISRNSLSGIAVPIREGEAVTASLGLFLPEFKLTPDHQARILKAMDAAATAIGAALTTRS